MAVAQQRKATTASLPSPIGGWNARDSLAEMNPLDAVQMVNFFPTPTDVTLRKGFTKHSIGISGAVLSLFNYSSPTGRQLFASTSSIIYNVDTSTATTSLTGNTSGQWVHTSLTTAGGSFMPAVNGADPMIVYDGTVWSRSATTSTAQTISTITRGGTGNLTATLTTAVAHGLVTGNTITVAGAVPAEFNGTYRITVLGPTTLTYTMATAPSGDASTVGTYTVKYYITGENSNTFATVNLFKERLYFVIENTLDFCYLPVDSINGAVTRFPLGGIFKNGGYLQAMGTWTIDAGYGVDDLAAFVTSNGEVAVYKGSDPSDPNDWALVGIWQLGQTFNRKCFFKFGGDLLVLTEGGLVPLSAGLQSTRLDPRVNITDKIFYAISQATTAYSSFYGWQINYFAKENMLILNVPALGGSEQYVMHNITKSWAKFTNIKANCWELSGEDMFFGGIGFVGKFYDTNGDAGTNIRGFVQQAYSYFESRGQLKRFTLVRPILQTDNGVPTVLCGLSVDFETVDLTSQISFNPAILQTGEWDIDIWDNTNWGGGGLTTTKIWQGVSGLGYAGSVSLNVVSQNIEFHWASTDYVMERGGVL
jgi:hypothetical protein